MFKSSEKLRHEAAQRSLDRVASSWRNARTTWFDGTPESIESRLAATERVLTVARSGYTPAHLELTVEAENARRELLAARHRLLVDFLDDGARAFKGSKRVAEVAQCPDCGQPFEADPHGGPDQSCEDCWDGYNAENNYIPPSVGYGKHGPTDPYDAVQNHGDYDGRHRAEAARRMAERGLRECINCGGALSGEEDDDKDSECGTCGKSAHKEGYRVSRRFETGLDIDIDTGSGASLRHRDDKENNRFTVQNIPGAPAGGPQRAIVNHDSTELMSADGAHHWASVRTAGQEVVWEGKACPDCAMAIANGDDSGASDEWSWDKLNHHTSQLPGDSGPIIACGEDDDCDSHFQRGPCDTCGSPYDGTFHKVVTMGPAGHHEGM